MCVRGLVVWVSLFPFLHPVRVGKRERKKGGNGDVKKHDGNRCELLIVVDFFKLILTWWIAGRHSYGNVSVRVIPGKGKDWFAR